MATLSSIAAAIVPFLTNPRVAVLLFVLFAAAAIDWRTGRIPEVLSIGGMLLGFVLGALEPPHTSGSLSAVGGALIAMATLLPLDMLRVLRASDVKLMAAVGAIVGHDDILQVILVVLVTAGTALLAMVAWQRGGRRMYSNLLLIVRAAAVSVIPPRAAAERIAPVVRLPYTLCICIGTTAFIVGRQAGTW